MSQKGHHPCPDPEMHAFTDSRVKLMHCSGLSLSDVGSNETRGQRSRYAENSAPKVNKARLLRSVLLPLLSLSCVNDGTPACRSAQCILATVAKHGVAKIYTCSIHRRSPKHAARQPLHPAPAPCWLNPPCQELTSTVWAASALMAIHHSRPKTDHYPWDLLHAVQPPCISSSGGKAACCCSHFLVNTTHSAAHRLCTCLAAQSDYIITNS